MKKGFTLIELLAVIVILAIIALIATPIVLNIINETKESAQRQSINNIIHAAENYHASSFVSSDVRINRNIYPKVKENVEGEKPDNGVIYINKDGKVAFSMRFDNNCYTKLYDDKEIKKEKKEECYLPFDYLPVSEKGDSTLTFFNGDVMKKDVEKLEFVTTNVVPSDAQKSWSVLENGSIMAWYYDVDNDGLYEVYIGQEGGVKANPDSQYLFAYFENLTEINLANLDTANVTTMYGMFNKCSNLTILDLSSFDTSNVSDMAGMFNECTILETVDLSSFDTSNVIELRSMFQYCSSLKTIDLSNFDTSNVTTMRTLFNRCTNLKTVNLSNFDTSNVTEMQGMFQQCTSLTELDLSNFNTSNVVNMHAMFYNCQNLTTLDLSSFDTSNVTNMTSMFNKCISLTTLDLSNFDTSNVTSMNEMFFETKMADLKLTNFNFKKVTVYEYMFTNSNITNIYIKEVGKSFISARLNEVGKSANIIIVN